MQENHYSTVGHDGHARIKCVWEKPSSLINLRLTLMQHLQMINRPCICQMCPHIVLMCPSFIS